MRLSKTEWWVTRKGITTEFSYYHFGNKPKFPSWYMNEKGEPYEIELIWTLPLCFTFKTFMKCLFRVAYKKGE